MRVQVKFIWCYHYVRVIIDAFHRDQVDIMEIGHIISVCRRLFTSHFTNSKIEFNRQQTNELAHTLTRVATLSVNFTTYYIVPHRIEQLIINEML